MLAEKISKYTERRAAKMEKLKKAIIAYLELLDREELMLIFMLIRELARK